MARQKPLSKQLQTKLEAEHAKAMAIHARVIEDERKQAEKLDNESVLEQFLLSFPQWAREEVRLQMVNAQSERYTLEYTIKARYPDRASELVDKEKQIFREKYEKAYLDFIDKHQYYPTQQEFAEHEDGMQMPYNTFRRKRIGYGFPWRPFK